MEAVEKFTGCDTPLTCAEEAGLKYLPDKVPGYTRKKAGEDFIYFDTGGRAVRSKNVIERINQLKIPPAWKDVWISPDRKGHLQATGKDAKGRKQYIYHPKWSEFRNRTKFNRMLLFGRLLPGIRKVVYRDIQKKELSREKVLATVVLLLDKTMTRIGGDEYAKKNKTFGLTTLRNKHVKNLGEKIRIEFSGKRGIEKELVVTDRRLTQIIRQCKEIPGWEVFKYFDKDGNKNTVRSEDVNQYLKDITGEDFTSKDFRTWGGSCRMIKSLLEMNPPEKETDTKKNISEAVKQVSGCLGNTASICRKYYIHPEIIESYSQRRIIKLAEEKKHLLKSSTRYLKPEERFFISFLSE